MLEVGKMDESSDLQSERRRCFARLERLNLNTLSDVITEFKFHVFMT